MKSRMCDPQVRFCGSWGQATAPGYPTWAWMNRWGWKSPVEPVGGNHESEATARDEGDTMPTSICAVRPCGMEARDAPRSRTSVNPWRGWSGLGERAAQREARYPTEAGTVEGAAIAGHHSSLPQEISLGPRVGGRAFEGHDGCPSPGRSRITS